MLGSRYRMLHMFGLECLGSECLTCLDWNVWVRNV